MSANTTATKSTSRFSEVPGGERWAQLGQFVFSVGTDKYFVLFEGNRENFDSLVRLGVGLRANDRTSNVIRPTTPFAAGLTKQQSVEFLNNVLDECVGTCPTEVSRNTVMDQITGLVKRYCGLSVDALTVLSEGYRCDRGTEIFDRLMEWTEIEKVNPQDRYRNESSSTVKTREFLMETLSLSGTTLLRTDPLDTALIDDGK